MMYMPDCIKATIDLMNVDLKKLHHMQILIWLHLVSHLVS